MWSKLDVSKFVAQHPVDTKGALAEYSPEIKYDQEDGDVYHIVIYPYWWQNNAVVTATLVAALDASTRGNTRVFIRDRAIEIHFYEHWCDPD